MLESHKIYLYDRIKETSYTIGTGNFLLNGPVNGFSSFGSAYKNGDNIFYAATDGSFYEVGSGVYITGVQNSIIRRPFKSSSNNSIVSFGEGLKEVFVTYPATNAVYSASGLQSRTEPKQSGVAFWLSSNIISHDNNLVWNFTDSRLGINKNNPKFAIDIGGTPPNSYICSSGVIVGISGISFPSGNGNDQSYIGGVQFKHYEPNSLSSVTFSDQILELSGVAKNNILLKKQNSGLVFAGPSSGCVPPCSPDYPTFRPLTWEDIPKVPIRTISDSSAPGSSGDICIDSNYLYVRNSSGWRRISLGGAF